MEMLRRIAAASWGQLIAVLVMLVSFRLYSAQLGPERFGQAMLGLGVVSLLDGLGAMAFSQVLAQMLKDSESRRQRIGLALGLGRIFALYEGALYTAALVLAGWWFGMSMLVWLAPTAAVFCMCENPRAAGMTVTMLERRLGFLSGWNAAEALMVLCTSLASLALTGRHPAALVLGALAGRALATLAISPLALGSPRGWRADHAAARAALPRALAFGWSIAVMSPLGWLGAFADRYLVGAFAGVVEAGVIAALAGVVMRPFGVVSAGLTNLFRPDLLDEAAGRAPVHARPLRLWLILALIGGGGGVIAFAILGGSIADFLIHFQTPDVDRGLLMTVLAASQIAVLCTHALDNRLLAQGRSRALLAALAIALALGLPMVATGALLGGANGAAWGRLGAEVSRMLASALLIGLARRGRFVDGASNR